MAEASEAPAHAAKGGLDFLKQKVGPLPIGVWLILAASVYWYLQRGKSGSGSATAANQQTDPAGNIGSIDPATGYVYGTPEDLAALAANNAGTDSTGTGAGGNATSGGQTYADNNAWGIAAINYLVGLGIDATTANQAIQQYLASQNLTTAQQADVNLAIGALGPPPTLPAPTTGNPGPVTGGGGGGGKAATVTVPNVVDQSQASAFGIITAAGLHPVGTKDVPGKTLTVDSQSPAAGTKAQKGATVTLKSSVRKTTGGGSGGGGGSSGGKGPTAAVPTGLVVSEKHSTSLAVKWNKSRNATGYHVKCTDQATKKVTNEFDVGANQATANCGGLTGGHSYVIDVWAEPESGAVGTGPHAEVSATLPKTG